MKVSFYKHGEKEPIVVEVFVTRNTPTVGVVHYDLCCKRALDKSTQVIAKHVAFNENDTVHPTYNVRLNKDDELFGRVPNKYLSFKANPIIIT